MNILVIGAGAIGSVFGGFLAQSGHDVTLVGRPWHMEAIRTHGLRISGIWGEHRITALSTHTLIPEGAPCDLCLLTVKSYQTEKAMTQLDRSVRDPVPVLSLQNGLGNLEAISRIAGVHRTLGGRVIFGAEIKRPGEVVVTVYADRVAVGPMKGSRIPARQVEELAAMIHGSGIPCFAAPEIERFIWGKVLYNVALNAPAAILEINYGKLLEHGAARDLMRGVLREAFDVARAEGVFLEWSSSDAYAEVLFERLIPSTASHFPSMLQDIHRQTRTEIDALNGALVELGRKHGIPTPINETLTRLIKFKEGGK